MEQSSDDAAPIEVVRAGLHAFAAEFTPADETSRANARALWANRPVALLLLDVVVGMEQDVATELARRLGRRDDDLEVHIFANAVIGVLRAAIRHAFSNPDHDGLISAVDIGLARVVPLLPSTWAARPVHPFDAWTHEFPVPVEAPAPRSRLRATVPRCLSSRRRSRCRTTSA